MTPSEASVGKSAFEQKVGHPPGLFVLFFAEMWERFSYYGMRALLVFYMMKGFLQYGDTQAYAVYGAYTSLVYATPFIGGMLADKLLGPRRAVILGGLLMAAGHLLMTIEVDFAFFLALALLICGNGFFKPNISTMVGALYPDKDRRDAGFTLFYMGINLGAALAPLLCGYVGEKYGWHYGFGLATIGMLIGLAVFVAPTRVTQALIVLGAVSAATVMVWTVLGNEMMLAINGFLAVALIFSAGFAVFALNHGGLPDEAGRPPSRERLEKKIVGPLTGAHLTYLGTLLAVPLIALLVGQHKLAGALLIVFGLLALGSILWNALKSEKVERERLIVVLILMFFSMLFWAFFEQAGSSVNNFTDRNVDRVLEERVISEADVGKPVQIELTQELLGRTVNGDVLTLDELEAARKSGNTTVTWTPTAADVGTGLGVAADEIPASVFQAANPIYILLFGLVFTALWTMLARRRLEPSTPVKFALGLLQLGLGFGAFWYGAQNADARGMVAVGWLLLGYLLHTTGELCLSPVGLSMVTKLSPARIVSTVMGGWFLATAFSNYLAGLIAMLTGIGHGAEGEGGIPPPSQTVHVYGTVFGQICIAACVSAVILFVISPLLRKWMHPEVESGGVDATRGGH